MEALWLCNSYIVYENETKEVPIEDLPTKNLRLIVCLIDVYQDFSSFASTNHAVISVLGSISILACWSNTCSFKEMNVLMADQGNHERPLRQNCIKVTKSAQCLSPPRCRNGYRQIVGENLTNCWEVTCDGLASRPGEVEILLVAWCYRNWDKLR